MPVNESVRGIEVDGHVQQQEEWFLIAGANPAYGLAEGVVYQRVYLRKSLLPPLLRQRCVGFLSQQRNTRYNRNNLLRLYSIRFTRALIPVL